MSALAAPAGPVHGRAGRGAGARRAAVRAKSPLLSSFRERGRTEAEETGHSCGRRRVVRAGRPVFKSSSVIWPLYFLATSVPLGVRFLSVPL